MDDKLAHLIDQDEELTIGAALALIREYKPRRNNPQSWPLPKPKTDFQELCQVTKELTQSIGYHLPELLTTDELMDLHHARSTLDAQKQTLPDGRVVIVIALREKNKDYGVKDKLADVA